MIRKNIIRDQQFKRYQSRRIVKLKELNEEVEASAKSVLDQMPDELKLVKTALVLGSGLSKFSQILKNKTELEYIKIKGWYTPTKEVKGHKGSLLLGEFDFKWYLVMQGRNHYYSGLSMYQCTYPVRVIQAIGCKNIIFTNACGGTNPDWQGSQFIAWKDHINMFGDDPLIGIELEDPFVDMMNKYDKDMRQLLIECGKEVGVDIKEGVYTGRTGPSYETVAEVKAYRSMGADCVGMSTVPECIVAAQVGLRIMVVSLAVSVLDYDSPPIDHDWVCKIIGEMTDNFNEFMKIFLEKFEE